MTKEVKDRLVALSKASDKSGSLSAEQLNIIYKEKWFKLFVPKEAGGLELSLPDGLMLEETIATIDGVLGWTITLCSGASQFVGYLDPELSRRLFANKKACFGGSGAITGIAAETDDGYIINGSWKYATGAPYCTHFTANCFVEKDGKALFNKEGERIFHSFLFEKEEVQIDSDWNTMGLKATASHSFSVHNLQVPLQRAFTIDGRSATLPGLIYQYPFLQFAETTLAVNFSGMALHFLEEFERLIDQWGQSKKYQTEITGRWKSLLNENVCQLQRIRKTFFDAVNVSWHQLTKDNSISNEILNKVSTLSKELAHVSRNVVTKLYPHCGVAATQNGTVLNQIFRDMFTASQHYLLNMP